MRRVLYAAIAAFAVVFTVADAYSCTYNGASLAGIPLTNPPLQIPQVVPSDHSLNGIRYWQFSLCTATPYSGCSQPAGYVVEINGNLDGCDASFVNALSDSWTFNYDGANALFGGQYQNPNDRIANVTLICDPSATTLTPKDPNVNAHPSQGGAVWVFDIVLKSNAVCGGPAPPGPTPPTPPGPTPPSGPTPPPGPNPGPAPKKDEPKSSPVAIVFVVFVFVGPAIYIGATVAYNYFKLGKRGRELAPHPEFWKDFPRLCFDGCKFVKNKFMQLIGKGDGTGTYGGDAESSYTKV